jgi:hypothetical protein
MSAPVSAHIAAVAMACKRRCGHRHGERAAVFAWERPSFSGTRISVTRGAWQRNGCGLSF